MSNPKLTVIIPAYNEMKVISKTISEVKKSLSGFMDIEIIVVDDNSTDGTYEECLKAAKDSSRIKVVKNTFGKGKGSALKCGFSYATGDFVTFLDADLDLHPSQIPTFFSYMKEADADIVVGSKRHPLSNIHYPFSRRILSWFYNLMIRWMFGLKVKDTQSGLKLFKHKVLKEVFPKTLSKRYVFDLELLVVASRMNYKIAEAPIKLNFQRMESRIKVRDIYGMLVDTLAVFYRMKILKYYDRVN